MRAEAEPVSERAGTVTFACRSAVWAQELDLLSAELLERLNEALGGPSLTRLRFVAGGRRRSG
jgi:predicted nucleic acid-binding Zn ribbon protein